MLHPSEIFFDHFLIKTQIEIQNNFLNFHYYRNFSPEDYGILLNNAVCAVGNSSSFIREGSYLGTPAVLVGDRQEGREHGENVRYTGYSKDEISKAIDEQISHGRYKRFCLFGDGKAGMRIAEILSSIELNIKKKLIL